MNTSSGLAGRLETISAGWRVAALAVLFICVLWPRIDAGTLWHHDELLTANRAREMLVRHDPGGVTFNFAPDFRKPPLQYWLVAAALRLLPGRPELAVRLPSLLGGAAGLLAVAFLAVQGRVGDGGRQGFAAAVALAGSGFFIGSARTGLLDTGAALCLTLVVAGCQKARRDPRWWWFVGGCAVVGAWQKAPYAFGAWALILWLRGREGGDVNAPQVKASQLPVMALGVALLVTAGWWLLQGWRHGYPLVFHALTRQMHALSYVHDPGDPGFRPYLYWFWLVRDWALVGLCVPFAVASAVWPRTRREDPPGPRERATAETGWVCAAYLGCLALTPFRAERYLVVVTPLLAWLTVGWLGEGPRALARWLPAASRRWLLPAALASMLPVAMLHYFGPAHGRPSLRAAARDLGRRLSPGEEATICADADPDFEVASFTGFYAGTQRPWRIVAPGKIGALAPPCHGLCHRWQWAAMRGSCPALRARADYEEWIVWERMP